MTDALKSVNLNTQPAVAVELADDPAPENLPPKAISRCADEFMALVDDQRTTVQDAVSDQQPAVATDSSEIDSIAADTSDVHPPASRCTTVLEAAIDAFAPIAQTVAAEEVVSPPAVEDEFKTGPGEADLNRIKRRLTDVPLDIRPAAGEMPTIESASAPPETLTPDRCIGCPECVPIVCSWTPWTICFRPLYFEEIGLERYGASWGIAQPAISGAHFFGRVVAMPYKMWVRCPRSCVCSNGFSRCGDPRPPGYGDCVWRWDAALFQAGVVAGIVIALP